MRIKVSNFILYIKRLWFVLDKVVEFLFISLMNVIVNGRLDLFLVEIVIVLLMIKSLRMYYGFFENFM